MNLLVSAMPVYAAGETIVLDDPDKSEFQAFTLNNMFPGDAEYKDYELNISHKNNIDVVFNVHFREESAKLAEVLMLKVEIDNAEKYNGLMKDLGQLTYTLPAGQPKATYRLTVYLDTSVGNEYQNKELNADFEWYYTPESSGGGSGGGTGGGTIKPGAGTTKLLRRAYVIGRPNDLFEPEAPITRA